MRNIKLNEDEEIRSYFADIVIPAPSDFDDFIRDSINKASEIRASEPVSSVKVIKLKKAIILVAAMLVFILGSISVLASIGAYKERMAKLSDESKQELLDIADSAEKEGWITSRPMTESEKKRKEELEELYMQQVLIPKDSIIIVNDMSEIITEQLCFYPKDNYFNFPEREMTDDELLQIVDHYYTTDYALVERVWENQLTLNEIPEEELINTAVKETSKYFNLSKEYLTSTYYYNIVGASDGGYHALTDVYVTDIKTGKSYTVEIDRLKNQVESISRTDENYSHDNLFISDQHFSNILNSLKATAEKIIGLKCVYSELNVELIKESYIDGGIGVCCYKMSDGMWTLIKFAVEDGEMLGITCYVYEDYINLLHDTWNNQSVENNSRIYKVIGDLLE